MALILRTFTKLLTAARHNYVEISIPFFIQFGDEKEKVSRTDLLETVACTTCFFMKNSYT
jgi:hypothetical protein